MVEGCWYKDGDTSMEERVVVILNGIFECILIPQMKNYRK